MLVGREAERARIETILARARESVSEVLVVRGEAGIGKTALLSHAADRADGFTVLSARGVESELEIPFAGLLELLRPALRALDGLPPRQADALRGALGLGPAVGGDSRLVGAATLGLLTTLAEERPLLVLLDDVQWLDPASAAALVFTARRLLADPVALLVGLRSGERSPVEGAGLPELDLQGLDAAGGRELLVRVGFHGAGGPLVERVVRASGGNPLALVELARAASCLRPGLIDEPLPVGARIERAMGRRLEGLSADARLGLLVAATDDERDLARLLKAAAELGGTLRGLEEAEDAGLVSLALGRLTFGHPLVRSVVYGLASPSERRAAHRALAAALTGGPDRDRRAWHEAAAAVGPDEEVAGRLAAAASRARERGGFAAAATGFERAAGLAPGADDRAPRLLEAAECAWLAGAAERALALLDEAGGLTEDLGLRADLAHLRGHIGARRGPVPPAIDELRRGAEVAARVGAHDEATEMLAEAAYAAFYAGDVATLAAVSERALALAVAAAPRARVMASIAGGVSLVLTGEGARGVRVFREAAQLVAATPALEEDARLLPYLGIPPLFLRDSGAEFAPLRRAVATARERGSLGPLPFGLFNLAVEAATSDRWPEATATYAEGIQLARETGLGADLCGHLAGLARVEARQGRVDVAREHAEEARRLARELGMPLFESWALAALADAAWALEQIPMAIEALEERARVLARAELDDVDLSGAPELVEAYLRVGKEHEARAQAAAHAVQAAAKGQPWALARAARSEALVADDAAFAARFRAAVGAHEDAVDMFELARTRLCFGQRLRRAGRRVEARPELRAARELFTRLGAVPWAEQADKELTATGETARPPALGSLEDLTPQELRVALRLAEGATTRQAAESLYLSPKTIEYHLRNVYLKLGINSRAALAVALDPDQSSSAMLPAAAVAVPGDGLR